MNKTAFVLLRSCGINGDNVDKEIISLHRNQVDAINTLNEFLNISLQYWEGWNKINIIEVSTPNDEGTFRVNTIPNNIDYIDAKDKEDCPEVYLKYWIEEHNLL